MGKGLNFSSPTKKYSVKFLDGQLTYAFLSLRQPCRPTERSSNFILPYHRVCHPRHISKVCPKFEDSVIQHKHYYDSGLNFNTIIKLPAQTFNVYACLPRENQLSLDKSYMKARLINARAHNHNHVHSICACGKYKPAPSYKAQVHTCTGTLLNREDYSHIIVSISSWYTYAMFNVPSIQRTS